MNPKILQLLQQEPTANTGASGTPAPVEPDVKINTEEVEFSYHFKKEKIKNDKNEVIGEGKKLPTIKVKVPVPSKEGILDIISAGGKVSTLLLDAVRDIIYNQGRQQINELRAKSPDVAVSPELLDFSKLDWNYIAKIPPGDRGLGISDEDFDDFMADYRAIMPKVLNKDADRIEKHVQVFKKKFAPIKTDKKALAVLKDGLVMWAANTSTMEENQEVYEFLSKRVDTLLREEEKFLAEAL